MRERGNTITHIGRVDSHESYWEGNNEAAGGKGQEASDVNVHEITTTVTCIHSQTK